MLLTSEKRRLDKLTQDLKRLSIHEKKAISLNENRKYFETLRNGMQLFEDVVFRVNRAGRELQGKDAKALLDIASEAIMRLGGGIDPSPLSLKDYEHHIHGPYLGVSDEGSAAHIIRRAALSSPKMKALGSAPPLQVGVAHDAERLAAVGEVAVGPEEYRDIILQCHGSILTSTNLGTRLNLRYYKMRPIIPVPSGPLTKAIEESLEEARRLVEPFWRTPDGNPRPVTLFVSFEQGTRFFRRLEILKSLCEKMMKGDIGDPKVHELGILARVDKGKNGLRAALDNIDLAEKVGVSTVALQGVVTEEAADKISMPGLLEYFSPEYVNELLNYAQTKKILVVPKNQVDPDTVARNVWSPLQVAHNMGLALGKYGLFPLTVQESSEVMGLIQGWFADWSAAPVFYVDFPIAGMKEVYTEDNIVNGAKEWLAEVARHKIPVVLFDTADKDKGRRLLKNSRTDRIGIFSLDEISQIDSYAINLGIKSLWAGGITIPQTLDFGKLGVFGVYVTSAAAATRPVSKRYAEDPMVVAEKEPTFQGVSRVKLLLEAGFLISCLRKYRLTKEADALENKAQAFITLLLRSPNRSKQDLVRDELSKLAEDAWKIHYKRKNIKMKQIHRGEK